MGPLEGVRVLDASRVLAGPYCGQILGDLGAEVVKLERPGSGDETRGWGPPFVGTQSAYFLSCNRNKKGITLDLSSEAGRQLFYRLVATSDILLENFRASSADKLGLGPAQLHQANDQLIICSISGFGRSGPLSELPGYDFAIQALSGLMNITGPVDGPPCKVGVAVTDVLTGIHAAVAVLACLHARTTSGHGYHIDLALLDCALAAQVNVAQAFLSSGAVPPRQGNAHLQIVPYQLFQTADSWLVLAVGNDQQFRHFCQQAEQEKLADDPRFVSNVLRVQHRHELIPLLEDILRSRTTAKWEELLHKGGVPCAPVWDYAGLFASPHVRERGLKQAVRDVKGNPVDLIGSPFHIAGAALPEAQAPPELGQHTQEVLQGLLGLEQKEIDDLRKQGTI